MLGPKVLELRAVGAGFFRQGHEFRGAREVTIVIGSDVGDEVRGLVGSDDGWSEWKVTHEAEPSKEPTGGAGDSGIDPGLRRLAETSERARR